MRAALAALTTVAVLVALGSTLASESEALTFRAKACARSEVENAVGRFVSAFNAGQMGQLDFVFAGRQDFKWYVTDAPGERALPAAEDRDDLLAYFARRHASGERLTLQSLLVNANTVGSGNLKSYGNFQYTVLREADDLSATTYLGKGALHCYHVRPDAIIVWAMARQA